MDARFPYNYCLRQNGAKGSTINPIFCLSSRCTPSNSKLYRNMNNWVYRPYRSSDHPRAIEICKNVCTFMQIKSCIINFGSIELIICLSFGLVDLMWRMMNFEIYLDMGVSWSLGGLREALLL